MATELSQTQVELGEQTRERLLDAAEALFARQGYAATSVREVTALAGSNIASVNYHFGGKHNLYVEMFRRRVVAMRELRVRSVQEAMAGSEAVLEDVLRAFAGAFLAPLVGAESGRVAVELIAREMLDPQLPRELLMDEVFGPVQQALAEALVASTRGLTAQRARLCVFSVIAQLIHVAHRTSKREMDETAEQMGTPWPLAELVEHIVSYSAAGVRACAQPGHSSGPPKKQRPRTRGIAARTR
jgi:AcrR family transcriptional regulator